MARARQKKQKTVKPSPTRNMSVNPWQAAAFVVAALDIVLAYTVLTRFGEGTFGVEGAYQSIALFFALFWGLGYTAMYSLKNRPQGIEGVVMSLAFGLGVFPFLVVVLNTLRIPLQWELILPLAYAVPLLSIADILPAKGGTDAPKAPLIHRRRLYDATAVFIALILLFVYLQGAFAYPYLEDDDPWEHATGTLYVAKEKTYTLPEGLFVSHYLEPYPPTYDVLMGVIHQTNNSVNWTLKFFNSLLIALGVVFFYYLVRSGSGRNDVALAATFLLAALPSYMNHFIWAQSLAIVLFYPAFYALQKIDKHPRWFWLACVLVASNMLIQPLANVIFGGFFTLYLIAHAPGNMPLAKKLAAVGAIGVALSMLYWAPAIATYGSDLQKINRVGASFKELDLKIGHQDTTYSLSDFMYAQHVGAIDQHIGFGFAVFWLLLASLALVIWHLKEELVISKPSPDDRQEGAKGISLQGWQANAFLITVVLWLVFTFVGVEGNELPVSVMPYKFWSYLAIPTAITSGYGLVVLLEKAGKIRFLPVLVLAVVVGGVLYTAAYPKYSVETANWPPGATWVYTAQGIPQLNAYYTLAQLPKKTRVFPTCYSVGKRPDVFDEKLIGFDLEVISWDREFLAFRRNLTEKTPGEIHSFMGRKGYDYLFVDPYCYQKLAQDQGDPSILADAQATINELGDAPRLFDLRFFRDQQGFIVFSVKKTDE